MIVKIKYKSGAIDVLYDVFSIEKRGFEIQIKISKKYVYTVQNFYVDKIKSIDILKV
jgi:hypothetical protein